MSFTIAVRRGPARLVPELKSAFKSGTSVARAFHQTSTKAKPSTATFFTPRTVSPILRSTPRNVFAQATRSYQTQQSVPPVAGDGGSTIRRLLTGGAIFGGTLIAINAVFNRETREEGIPAYEASYLNETFLHTGLGVGIIGLTARQMISSGLVYRLMVTNPWVVAIGGLALSFGTMIGTRSIAPDK
jgi:growth hormone-inducible transmembrane protein